MRVLDNNEQITLLVESLEINFNPLTHILTFRHNTPNSWRVSYSILANS